MTALQDIVDRYMTVLRVERDWPAIQETTTEDVEAVVVEDVSRIIVEWLESLKPEEPRWGSGHTFLKILQQRAEGKTLDEAVATFGMGYR